MALTDDVQEVEPVWVDDNPFYLIIMLDDERISQIDLGERGWIAKNNELGFLREPGTWYLARKDGTIAGMMLVLAGEQPYYMARHVGIAGATGSMGETTAYGIGKKRLDCHVYRLWFMANGVVTLGDDLEPLAIRLMKQGQL